MLKYKTVLSDYEGMQSTLDSNAVQGWRLFSVTPDTWRKTMPSDPSESQSPFEGLNAIGTAATEYTASYYLLVFQRDEPSDSRELAASASEERPMGSRSRKSPFQNLG